MKIVASLVLLLACCSFVASAADMIVPEKLIGKDTIAVVDLQLGKINRDQLVKSVKDAVGDVPPEALKQFDDTFAAIKAIGAASASLVLNMPKDAPKPEIIIVIGKAEGADSAKILEFVYAMDAGIKEKKNAECPVDMDNCVVLWNAQTKLPEADGERLKAFQYAFSQVPADQTVSVVFVPSEGVVAMATGTLKGEEADLAKSILGGNGMSLSTGFGAAAEPTVSLLVMAADAGGAETLGKVATAAIAEVKKLVPPNLQAAVDTLKAVQAGANVQISIGLADWNKVSKDVLGTVGMK